MRNSKSRFNSFISVRTEIFGVAIFVGLLGVFQARPEHSGPPPWTNTVIQTVGGITYFVHTSYPVSNCHRIGSGPVLHSPNLSQFIAEDVADQFCVPSTYHAETHVSVLGALAPGNYFFYTSTWDGLDNTTMPWTAFAFTVPASEPTLTSWMDTNTQSFHLSVAGISNVNYVVQSTSDFTNWTSIVTNNGGPFVWSEPISNQPTHQFFRVQLIGQ
jgi:hypothetical protein